MWTNVHKILGHCRGPFAVSNAVADCLSCFVSKFADEVAVKLRNRRKTSRIGSFGAPIFRGRHLKFCTCIFKSGSRADAWQVLVVLL